MSECGDDTIFGLARILVSDGYFADHHDALRAARAMLAHAEQVRRVSDHPLATRYRPRDKPGRSVRR
jgi:hypothetical protein